MNEQVAKLLNEQINKEFYSAYLYLDIANYYDELDLDGYANYYMIQAQEERDHALLTTFRTSDHSHRIYLPFPSFSSL